MTDALPTGRPGRLLALAIALVLLTALGVGLGTPLLEQYRETAERLALRKALAARMEAVAAGLPELRPRAGSGANLGPASSTLLEGASDALASAALQQTVQDMGAQAGVSLSSLETLPATQAGAYRQIAVRVALTAPWAALVGLLGRIERASPRMLVDDLQVRAQPMVARPSEPTLDAGLTVIAFRGAAAASGSAER